MFTRLENSLVEIVLRAHLALTNVFTIGTRLPARKLAVSPTLSTTWAFIQRIRILRAQLNTSSELNSAGSYDMDWFVKAFVRASLAWFTVGIALGLAMAIHPAWVVYRPAHAHMNVVGFITMMIFGVGYQLLPRMFGHKLQSRALAIAHWWLANVGLAMMVAGFMLNPHIGIKSAPITSVGGSLFAIGAFAFVYNLWRTFNAADARNRAGATASSARTMRTLDS